MKNKQCKICGNKLGSAESKISVEANVCSDCLGKEKCETCGMMTDTLVKGKCLFCHSLEKAKAEREYIDETAGGDISHLTKSIRKMSDEDIVSFLTFGQGNFTKKE